MTMNILPFPDISGPQDHQCAEHDRQSGTRNINHDTPEIEILADTRHQSGNEK